jgi:hypothetical protein
MGAITETPDVKLLGQIGPLVSAAVVVGGLAVTGCGGGGKTSAEGPSKAEYIAKADAICGAEQAKREDLESRVTDLGPITAGETHDVARLLRKAGDDLRVEIRRLRALRAPAAEARTPASLLSFLADEVTHLDGWADAYDDRNAKGIRAFQARIAEDSAKASAVAKHYGFQVCGSPGNGNPGNLTRFR